MLVLLLAGGCHSRVRQARTLIDRGSLPEARKLLGEELAAHPDDPDARFLVGEIDLREDRPDRAKGTFAPILTSDQAVWRVSQAYRDSVHRIELSGDAKVMATEATEAAHLNSLAAPEMCKALLGRARRDQHGEWMQTVDAAGQLSSDCRAQTIALLRSWIDTSDPEIIDADALIRIATEAKKLDPSVARDFAHAARDVAVRVAKLDRFRANDIVQRLGSIDVSVAYEMETAMLRSHVGPIEVEGRVEDNSTPRAEAPSQTELTIRTLREIGEIALNYKRRNGMYPRTESFLEAWRLLGTYVPSVYAVPASADAWGNPLAYRSNGNTARIESGGPDGSLGTTADNIVWEDGKIVQPVSYQ